MRSGKFLNDWKMVETFTKEAPDRVYELEQWGALFNRTPEGKISQRPFGGHTYRRLCHVGDRTGLELIRTMQEKVLATDAKVYMETTVTKLFKKEGRVVGALAYTRENGKFVHFKARAVVMATGGWGRLFKGSSNSLGGACAAREACSATPRACGIWRTTTPRRWSSLRATWWRGRTTQRCRRAAAASTAGCIWTLRTSATTGS